MKTVCAYPLKYGENKIKLPIGAKILNFGIQDGNPNIFALVDTSCNSSQEVRITITSTGEPNDPLIDFWSYANTVSNWHCFYIKENKLT